MIKFLDNIIYSIIIINFFICEIQCRSLLFLNTEPSLQASEEDIRNFGYKQFSSYNNDDMQASIDKQNDEPLYGTNEEEFKRYSLLMNSRNKDNNKESLMDYSEKNNDKYNKLSSLSSSISNNEYYFRNMDSFKEKSNTQNNDILLSKLYLNTKLPFNINNDDNHDNNNNNNNDTLSTFSSLFSFSSPSSSSMPIFKSSETFNENISKSSYESNLKNDNDVKSLFKVQNSDQINDYLTKTKNDVPKSEGKKESFSFSSYDESGKSISNDMIKSSGKKGSFLNDDEFHKGLSLIDNKDNKDMSPKDHIFHPLMKDPLFRKEFEKEFVESLNNKEINFTSTNANINNSKTNESDQHAPTLVIEKSENNYNISKNSTNSVEPNDDKLESKNNTKADYIKTWDEEFHLNEKVNKKDEKKEEDNVNKSKASDNNQNEILINDFAASESKSNKKYKMKSVSEINNGSSNIENKRVEDKRVEDKRVEDIYFHKNVTDRNTTNGIPYREEEVSRFDKHEVYNDKAPIKPSRRSKGRKHHEYKDDLSIRVNIIFSEIPDMFMPSLFPYNNNNKQKPSLDGPGLYGDTTNNNNNNNNDNKKKDANNEPKFNILKLMESFEQFKTNTNNVTDTKLSSQITELNTTHDDVFIPRFTK